MNLNFVKSIYHSDVCRYFWAQVFSQWIKKQKEKIEPILSQKMLKKYYSNLFADLDSTSSTSFYDYAN